MSEISDLYQRLSSLPSGYISKKTIHGKVYFYHQYSENGKLVSRYVDESEAELLDAQFVERKQILARIKEIESAARKRPTLSPSARAFDGFLMSGDRVVASFDKGILTNFDEKRCPFIVKRTKSIEAFLSNRVLDSGRTNARLLKKALGITETNDEHVAMYAYGASIGDDYWFKPKHSKLRYQDVCFANDIYAELSLTGKLLFSPKGIHLTPELTTRGSLEKGWRKKDGHWYLYKNESPEQVFSELLAYQLAVALGIPTAEYGYDSPYVFSKNFAEEANFEPMVSFLGENDEYEFVYSKLKVLGKEILKQYLNLMRFDVLIVNVDRHNENYGLMRNKKSGDVLSLSPNFDNNLCLYGYQNKLPANPKTDGMMKLFSSFLRNAEGAMDLLRENPLPSLTDSQLAQCVDAVPASFPGTREELIHFLRTRIDYLNELLKL